MHEIVIVGGGAGGLELATRLGDAGLESNRINQLLVGPTLQTMRDENIFAFGECAACPWPERGGTVPARAQAAHQQASHLLAQIRRRLAGKPPREYRYRDFGSLVSLGEFSTVANMMGALVGGSLMIEGSPASCTSRCTRCTNWLCMARRRSRWRRWRA